MLPKMLIKIYVLQQKNSNSRDSKSHKLRTFQQTSKVSPLINLTIFPNFSIIIKKQMPNNSSSEIPEAKENN